MRNTPVILSSSLKELLSTKREESRAIRAIFDTLTGRLMPNIRYCWSCDHPTSRLYCMTATCDYYGTGTRISYRSRPSRIIADRLIGDHFTFREKKGMISYMPRGKEQKITESGQWAMEGRQAVSPGKWLRSMFSTRAIEKLKLGDHEFAVLSTAIKHDELANELSFKFVPFGVGYEYGDGDGTRYSCMAGKPVGPFYSLFGAKCLACYNGNKVMRGRAVVWFDVNPGSRAITFMDRIYSDSPEIEEAFKQHAMANGWYHKQRQSRDSCSRVVTPDGNHTTIAMVVCAKHEVSCEFYPYLDTFHSGDLDSLQNDDDGDYTYDSTSGDRSGSSHENDVTDVDGNYISTEDAVEVDGDWYRSGDRRIVWSQPEHQTLLRENAVEIDGDWHSVDSRRVVQDIDDEYQLRADCQRVDGDWYPENDDRIVWSQPGCRYLLREDAVEVEGQWYPDGDSPLEFGSTALAEDHPELPLTEKEVA